MAPNEGTYGGKLTAALHDNGMPIHDAHGKPVLRLQVYVDFDDVDPGVVASKSMQKLDKVRYRLYRVPAGQPMELASPNGNLKWKILQGTFAKDVYVVIVEGYQAWVTDPEDPNFSDLTQYFLDAVKTENLETAEPNGFDLEFKVTGDKPVTSYRLCHSPGHHASMSPDVPVEQGPKDRTVEAKGIDKLGTFGLMVVS